MRTTIELKPAQRAELLRLAAKRGIKGFSSIIEDALDEYLLRESRKQHLILAALETRGAFSGKGGEEFESRASTLREKWR